LTSQYYVNSTWKRCSSTVSQRKDMHAFTVPHSPSSSLAICFIFNLFQCASLAGNRSSSSFAMSKVAGKKLHWRSKVQENFVPLVGGSGELGVAIGGGADYGEFPFVTAAPGGGITVGDIILEIGGTPVLGMTLGDVRGVLNSCPHPVRIKTVSPGSTLCKDLRLYLSKCFTPGSMDSQLQQVIRENLYLRAVPCTTRQPRDGEISGVDYNFVSVEEFFSLEESGALLESGKFKGNYYGTPRPVHIGPDSPPITYQEHRSLLRKFRTRCKSLSNLEKAEEGYNSEEDSGLSGRQGEHVGGSGGANSIPAHTSSPSQSRDSSGGDGSALENGGGPSRGLQGAGLETWEMTYSDSGEPYYTDHQPKPAPWHSYRSSSKEAAGMTELGEFTDQPGELRGYSVHTQLYKGPRGFGFNIVGGSRNREFLQVYSITSGGPPTLNPADILVYINDSCVLGTSHKEVVEMLKAVPIGQSVDVVVRRGYPMLYDRDGCRRQHQPGLLDAQDPASKPPPPPPPTTTQPQAQGLLPRTQAHLSRDGTMVHAEGRYPGSLRGRASRLSLDANGNTSHLSPPPRPSPSYLFSNGGNGSFLGTPPSARGIRRLQSADLASQSDSEVVSAIGSHRASLIRNHNNNSLCPPSPLRLYSAKFSEGDLSSYMPTPPASCVPLHLTETSPTPSSSSPGRGQHYSKPRKPKHSLLTPPTSGHSDGLYFTFNGAASASSGSPGSSIPSPATRSGGGRDRGRAGGGSRGGAGGGTRGGTRGGTGAGELVPVALAKCEDGRGMGFSVTAGGHGGRRVLVKRVWDLQQCGGLQPGDAIVKVNGADVQSLSFTQVETGPLLSPMSPNPVHPHSSTPPCPASTSQDTPSLPRNSITPPPQALVRSSLVQSTSFLDSVPVTLTLEPRDWMYLEDGGTVLSPRVRTEEKARPSAQRGVEVELRRRPGEGFGFVIASQDVENSRAASLLPHRFVTVRRGSPAARSGQIRPGDRLEAVEGRSVVSLPHRELAQILRRAGNTLRLTIVPRSSTHSSEHSDYEYDPHYRSKKPHRPKPKVSDQLVEINGRSTAGMSHGQAVEQIRSAGHRIHLVLKKGNGYVPDYGRDHRTAVSSLPPTLQSRVATVSRARRRPATIPGPPSTARRTHSQDARIEGGEGNPESGEGTGHRSKHRGRSRASRSLSRNGPGGASEEEEDKPAVRGRERERGRRREEREKRSKSEESWRQFGNDGGAGRELEHGERRRERGDKPSQCCMQREWDSKGERKCGKEEDWKVLGENWQDGGKRRALVGKGWGESGQD
ncbi:hypothetical protein P4O66_017318, partial [Electrophorus voltai]